MFIYSYAGHVHNTSAVCYAMHTYGVCVCVLVSSMDFT